MKYVIPAKRTFQRGIVIFGFFFRPVTIKCWLYVIYCEIDCTEDSNLQVGEQ